MCNIYLLQSTIQQPVNCSILLGKKYNIRSKLKLGSVCSGLKRLQKELRQSY